MRKFLFLCAAVVPFLWSSPAGAATVSAKATITCTSITVDPPAGTGVTFSGTINGTAYTVTAAPVPGTHNSTADIHTLTTGTGPLTIVTTPDFTVPENPYGIESGPGVTVTVTLTCHTAPTTTTSTSTSTTSTTAASSTSTSTSTTMVPSRPPAPTCGGPGQLPCTGTNTTVPGALVGGTAIAAGAALVVGARRRRPVR